MKYGIPQSCLGTSALQCLHQWHRQWDLSTHADDMKLSGAVDTTEAHDPIQDPGPGQIWHGSLQLLHEVQEIQVQGAAPGSGKERHE